MFEFLPFIIVLALVAILGIILIFSRYFAALGGKILNLMRPFRSDKRENKGKSEEEK